MNAGPGADKPTLLRSTTRSLALEVPARAVPVPTTVSVEMQKIIGAPFRPTWNIHPTAATEWAALVDALAAVTISGLPALRGRFGVEVEKTVLGGVRAFTVTPKTIARENRDRLLIHLHGGCYVLSPGEAALPEAILMAGFGGFKVISIDYRMPPEAYFPGVKDRRLPPIA